MAIAGRHRIGDAVEVFNDLAFLAGLTPQLFFQDIGAAFLSAVSSPGRVASGLPLCHAVVVAVSGVRKRADGRDETMPNAVVLEKTETDLTWYPQRVRHIPDVYALLHAVMNCSVPGAIEPNTVLDRLASRSRHATVYERAALVQQASDLQKVFLAAVTNSIWGLPGRGDAGVGGQDAAKTTTRQPSATVPDRYYAFVMAASTGAIYCIDNYDPPRKVDCVRDGAGNNVLTDAVVTEIVHLLSGDTSDGEAMAIGLVSREA